MPAEIVNLAKWKAEHPPVVMCFQAGYRCWSAWVKLWCPWLP